MIIKELSVKNYTAWDEFAGKTKGGTLFHRIQWKTLLEDAFGYTPYYFFAEETGKITGILPLFLIKYPLVGKKLISVPHAVVGGICAENQLAQQKLVEHAIALAGDLCVNHLELRQEVEVSPLLTTDPKYFTFRLDLRKGREEIWHGMRKSMRRAIKKAENEGLEVDLEYDDYDYFLQWYERDMRRMGTPSPGKKWYLNLINAFPEYHSIGRIHKEGKNISLFLIRRYAGTVSEVIGNDLPKYRHLNPNQLLEWSLILDGIQKGYHCYDFGRSIKESGSYFFKLGWGAVPIQLHYQFYLPQGGKIPDISQTSRKRKMFAVLWKCMPLAISSRLGPVIRRIYP